MKLFSVKGFYDDGYRYSGEKTVWTTADTAEEATNKVVSRYNSMYDTVFKPHSTVEIDGKDIIFNSIELHF